MFQVVAVQTSTLKNFCTLFKGPLFKTIAVCN